jgi:hypothetical protein
MATRAQLKNQYAERYVKSMLRNIKVRGKQPITHTPDGVVVDHNYGGGCFQNEQDAYVSVYLHLMHPESYAKQV